MASRKERAQHKPRTNTGRFVQSAETKANEAAACRLRAAKMSYADIARECGYGSASAARNAVMRALERTVCRDAEKLRREELDSLDRLEKKCWERLYDPTYAKSMLFAVDRILACKERRARLMGLDIKSDAYALGERPELIVQEAPAGYFSPYPHLGTDTDMDTPLLGRPGLSAGKR